MLKVGSNVSFLLDEINGRAAGVHEIQEKLQVPRQKGVFKLGTIKRPVRKHDDNQQAYGGIVVDDESKREIPFIELSLRHNEDKLLAGSKVRFNINIADDEFDKIFPGLTPSETVPGFVLNLKRYEVMTISDELVPYDEGMPNFEDLPPREGDSTGFGQHSLGSCAEIAESLLGGFDVDPSPAIAFNAPFLAPVNTKRYSTYRKFIATPMDLSTVYKKFKRDEKDRYVCSEDFRTDIKLITENCVAFNGKDHPISLLASQLRGYFDDLWNPSRFETFSIDDVDSLPWLKPAQVVVNMWQPSLMETFAIDEDNLLSSLMKPVQVAVEFLRSPAVPSPLSGEEADNEASYVESYKYIANKHPKLNEAMLQAVTDVRLATPPTEYIDFQEDLTSFDVWPQQAIEGVDAAIEELLDGGSIQSGPHITDEFADLVEVAVNAIEMNSFFDENEDDVEPAGIMQAVEADDAEGEPSQPDVAAEAIMTGAVIPANLLEQVHAGNVSKIEFPSTFP